MKMETKNCTRYQKHKKFIGLCVSLNNPQTLDKFYDVTGMKNGILHHWKSEQCKACISDLNKSRRLKLNGGIKKIPKRPKAIIVQEKNCSKLKSNLCISTYNPQPIENFRFKKGRTNGSSICKSCEYKYSENNRDRAIYRSKIWNKDPQNKEQRLQKNRKRLYNLEPQQYNEMFQKQKGCCAICFSHNSNLKQGLCIDHCHKSEKVRKLLCNKCNQALGLFNEDINIMQTAIEYIKKHSEES